MSDRHARQAGARADAGEPPLLGGPGGRPADAAALRRLRPGAALSAAALRCLPFLRGRLGRGERRGTLHSWTVAHHPYHPAFRAELPYTLATVDLAEGVRLVAQLRDAGPDALRLGLKLRVGFEPAGEGLVLPVLRPASG